MNPDDFAFVTLATNDSYGNGALVLAHSLRIVQSKHKLVILVTNNVSNNMREKMSKVFDLVQDVSTLDSKDTETLAMMERPELGVTLTKIHCWKLVQFSKCVFLDADVLVLKNCDELFEKPELSAVPDVGWPDCFNSGVFVFKPSLETFNKLLQLASEKASFDGGDQGLLNMYFNDWATKDIAQHLSFIYNMNIGVSYTYLPAYQRFGKDVKIVHFLGTQKPWTYTYHKDTESVTAPYVNDALYQYLKNWWKIYSEHVDVPSREGSNIAEHMSNLAMSPNKESGASLMSPERDEDRLSAWEQGHIDYMGRDSYENIQKKLDDVINGSANK